MLGCLLATEGTSPAPAKDWLQINKGLNVGAASVHGAGLEQKEGS